VKESIEVSGVVAEELGKREDGDIRDGEESIPTTLFDGEDGAANSTAEGLFRSLPIEPFRLESLPSEPSSP